MAPGRRQQNHRVLNGNGNGNGRAARPRPIDRRAWLAAPIGATLIVGLASLASLAQATESVFVAASLVFSLCEGVILAIVSFIWWSRRGISLAVLAAVVTAAAAAPARWEVAILTRQGLSSPQPADLLADLLITLAWGAFAGLAGATVLRPRLAALMHDAETRFTTRPPR